MSIEIIVLGVANALRPTSLACVYAILATTEPRRLLTAFLLAGFSFSLATGVIVVSLIHGAQIRHGTSTFRSRQPPRRRRHPPSRAPLPRGAEPDLVRRTAARAAIVEVTVFNALWWSVQ